MIVISKFKFLVIISLQIILDFLFREEFMAHGKGSKVIKQLVEKLERIDRQPQIDFIILFQRVLNEL